MIKTRYEDYEILKVYLNNDIFYLLNKNDINIKIYNSKASFKSIIDELKSI